MGTARTLKLSSIKRQAAFVIWIDTLMLWQLQNTKSKYRAAKANKIYDTISKVSVCFYT